MSEHPFDEVTSIAYILSFETLYTESVLEGVSITSFSHDIGTSHRRSPTCHVVGVEANSHMNRISDKISLFLITYRATLPFRPAFKFEEGLIQRIEQ